VFFAGSDEQKARFVSPFLEGRGAPLAALANTEPGGSANYAAPPPHGTKTKARVDGDSWVIDGEKQWVSSATGWEGKGADVLFVVCRTEAAQDAPAGLSIIAVPQGTAGLEPVRFIDTLGHRAHLCPVFRLEGVRVPIGNLVGPRGGAQAVVASCFSGTAAIVGAMSVGVMRAAFDFALNFCRTDARGGPQPIIEYPTVGYALADAKGAIEACRWLALRASAAMDAEEPCALELNLHAKVFCSETAVRVLTDLMRVVGIDSYDHTLPLAALLQDAMALPLFDGGNNGVRRRQLHAILKADGYDPLGSIGAQ
jgi:alkylation response protein AidB-like acyl-CoA dehydrogenase